MSALSKEDKYAKHKEVIKKLFEEHERRLGYKRMTKHLYEDYQIRLNHKTVYRLMKELRLVCKVRKVRRYNSYKGDIGQAADNILNRNFKATKPNEKWVTDVTEFKVNNQRVYLSPMIDLYDRSVVGYSISKSPNMKMIKAMLDDCLGKVNPGDKLLIHTDQGWHYRHKYYTEIFNDTITQSMSRKANCLDNAMAENFFGHLKSEMYHGEYFESADDLIDKLHKYIKYYNSKRRSSSIKYATPNEYRNNYYAA